MAAIRFLISAVALGSRKRNRRKDSWGIGLYQLAYNLKDKPLRMVRRGLSNL
jgi:hypothetical protein